MEIKLSPNCSSSGLPGGGGPGRTGYGPGGYGPGLGFGPGAGYGTGFESNFNSAFDQYCQDKLSRIIKLLSLIYRLWGWIKTC